MDYSLSLRASLATYFNDFSIWIFFVYELSSFLGIFSKLSFLKERVGEAETPEITGGVFFLNEVFFYGIL